MPRYTIQRRRDGSGFITTVIVTFMVTGLLSVVVRGSAHRAFMAQKLADRTRAQAIAEAGVSRAYALLAQDFDLRTNDAAFPPTEYGGGCYDVTVIAIGEDLAVIQSTAEHDSTEETAILDVRWQGGSASEGGPAYECAILAAGQISWTGCGVFTGDSRVHGNGLFKQAGSGELNAWVTSSDEVTLNGNSGEIDGDVTAPDVSGKTSKVTGTITETAVDEIAIPQIDLVPYYNEALAHGEVYEGDRTISGSFSPAGGIMWVNGNLQISGSGNLTGCFIATGDIHVSGSGTHAKMSGYPGFVSRDGSIKFSGSSTREGLVYARIGSVEITGSGSLTGSIICGGDFKKAGCSTIVNYVDSTPVAPNAAPGDGVLCVQAWQR